MAVEQADAKRLADEAGAVEKKTREMPKQIERAVEELKKPHGPVEKAIRNMEKLKQTGSRGGKPSGRG